MLTGKGSVSLQWWLSQLNIHTHTHTLVYMLSSHLSLKFHTVSFFCWISGSLLICNMMNIGKISDVYYPQGITFLGSIWLVLVCLYRYLCHFSKFLSLTPLALWISTIKMHILKIALKTFCRIVVAIF